MRGVLQNTPVIEYTPTPLACRKITNSPPPCTCTLHARIYRARVVFRGKGILRHRKLRCACSFFFPIPSHFFLWQVEEVSTKRKYEKIMINTASMCRLYHFWYTKVAFSQVYTHAMPTTKLSDTRESHRRRDMETHKSGIPKTRGRCGRRDLPYYLHQRVHRLYAAW